MGDIQEATQFEYTEPPTSAVVGDRRRWNASSAAGNDDRVEGIYNGKEDEVIDYKFRGGRKAEEKARVVSKGGKIRFRLF